MTETEPRPASDGPEQHKGQLRFAERFTRAYGNQFMHAHGIGWHEYDGARFSPCKDGAPQRAVVKLIKDALAQAAMMSKDDRKPLLFDISKVESAAGVNGVLTLAQNLLPCSIAADLLDADALLFNTRSGTVHLETGAVRAPTPADHLSKVANARFQPDARSDLFDDFLETIQPDVEMREFLARQVGSALLGRVREHKLFIWHGAGANGKGTLRDAIRYALGDYAVEVPADILLQNRYGQQALAPERMRLRGARVAFCSEIAQSAQLDEATMKKLTGGDPVNAKLLYRDPIEFEPSHTLFMLTNHLPQVRGDDPATWRRLMAVPFDVVVPAEKRDGELPEKLKAGPEPVLAWLWHGWLDYQRNGLNPPQAVLQATQKYQTDSDTLARFLHDESTICLGHGTVGSGALYHAFTHWLRQQGEDLVLTQKAFTTEMENRGYKRTPRTRTGVSWVDLMLVDDQDGRDGRRALATAS